MHNTILKTNTQTINMININTLWNNKIIIRNIFNTNKSILEDRHIIWLKAYWIINVCSHYKDILLLISDIRQYKISSYVLNEKALEVGISI